MSIKQRLIIWLYAWVHVVQGLAIIVTFGLWLPNTRLLRHLAMMMVDEDNKYSRRLQVERSRTIEMLKVIINTIDDSLRGNTYHSHVDALYRILELARNYQDSLVEL
jgi:hypothetical protein